MTDKSSHHRRTRRNEPNPARLSSCGQFYELALTRGQVCFVSVEDYPKVATKIWYASKCKRNTSHYAATAIYLPDGRHSVLLMHRLLLDAPHGMQVDHKNNDGLDNRRSNIRLCTAAENARNRPARARNKASSQWKGVYFDKQTQQWKASIVYCEQTFHLGYHNEEADAAMAYNAAALSKHGDYACINSANQMGFFL